MERNKKKNYSVRREDRRSILACKLSAARAWRPAKFDEKSVSSLDRRFSYAARGDRWCRSREESARAGQVPVINRDRARKPRHAISQRCVCNLRSCTYAHVRVRGCIERERGPPKLQPLSR
ncbi:uncharacterized protein LOC143348473 [Colletes latitarsis]|uniref:uncharacterized protein LOC143348473 n=1 Tax=Colletes latitarsis TaxID=2605962 RepID=UPI0040372AFB